MPFFVEKDQRGTWVGNPAFFNADSVHCSSFNSDFNIFLISYDILCASSGFPDEKCRNLKNEGYQNLLSIRNFYE